VGLEAVDELDGAVMFQSQAIGERLNGGFVAFRKAANGEQHQVLLRLKTHGAGFGVAFAQKMADAVPKLRKGLVFGGGDLPWHNASIS
jgi:hypothetical protein